MPSGRGKQSPVARRRRRRWTTVAPWLIAWALLFALWMALAGTLAPSEIVAGSAGAAIAATAVEVVRRQGLARFRPDPAWLRYLWRLPWRTLKEFGLVMGVLWRMVALRRRVGGRFVSLPFPVGGNDGRSSARRALFTAGASFAPNSYVVDFDRAEGRVLVHQLAPPYPKDVEDVLP
jgi:multisubunit Na+/H+ antiporter MnhE subunit